MVEIIPTRSITQRKPGPFDYQNPLNLMEMEAALKKVLVDNERTHKEIISIDWKDAVSGGSTQIVGIIVFADSSIPKTNRTMSISTAP